MRQINCDFAIPMYHRSIITPDGKIFLNGGIGVEYKKAINKFYQYDVAANKLVQLADMRYGRNQHSLICVNHEIFAIGGQSSNNELFLDKCEKFSLSTMKWTEIAPMNQKAAGVALASFQHQFIFKFGGFQEQKRLSTSIERFDIKNNVWSQIQVQNSKQEISYEIPAYSGATFIGLTDLLILGGKSTDRFVDSCYLVRMAEDMTKGSLVETRPLPKYGSVTSQVLVSGHMVFALQNVGLEKLPDLINFSRKSLLAFNSRVWKEVL